MVRVSGFRGLFVVGCVVVSSTGGCSWWHSHKGSGDVSVVQARESISPEVLQRMHDTNAHLKLLTQRFYTTLDGVRNDFRGMHYAFMQWWKGLRSFRVDGHGMQESVWVREQRGLYFAVQKNIPSPTGFQEFYDFLRNNDQALREGTYFQWTTENQDAKTLLLLSVSECTTILITLQRTLAAGFHFNDHHIDPKFHNALATIHASVSRSEKNSTIAFNELNIIRQLVDSFP